MEKIRPDIFRMEGRKSRHQFQINRENLINGPNSRCNHGGVSPLNHVPAKPPFHPEKGGCLQGVCIPVGFALPHLQNERRLNRRSDYQEREHDGEVPPEGKLYLES